MRLHKRFRKNDRDDTDRAHSFTNRLQEVLDVPLECVSSVSTIEIKGDDAVVVNGCGGVLLYAPEMIRMRGRDGTVTVHGSSLEMESLIGDRVTIHGKIHSVCLHEEEKMGKAVEKA